MSEHRVVLYRSSCGGRLEQHEQVALAAVAAAIADIKGCPVGTYCSGDCDAGGVFFVPDDTLMADEAARLGIRSPDQFYGGIVPRPFVRTKAITHALFGPHATRPDGWSAAFAERVRDVVLPGYTAFAAADARQAAERLLAGGPVRVKRALGAGRLGQAVIDGISEFDGFLETCAPDELAAYGLVIEPNLRDVTTRSVGQTTLGDMTIAYQGTQRRAIDNHGHPAYGGSELVCLRGGWDALDRLPLSPDTRLAVKQARAYDAAMSEYPGFIATRRNYDVGQGLDASGTSRSGTFEASWRAGGASTAELAAIAAFAADPELEVVETSIVKQYGEDLRAPPDAVVHFAGNDPEAGPIIRYTRVTRREKREIR